MYSGKMTEGQSRNFQDQVWTQFNKDDEKIINGNFLSLYQK